MNQGTVSLASAKRWQILNRVAHLTSRRIQDPLYYALSWKNESDTADGVAERVKDNVWARIPGEQSS